jgi:ribosomal protein S7
MPRKSRSYDKHTPLPDPKYGSVKYAKFINYMMERGKKNTARQIFYDALKIVEEKMSANSPSDRQLGGSATMPAKPALGGKSSPAAAAPTAPPASAKAGTDAAPKPAEKKVDGRSSTNSVSAATSDKKVDGRQAFDQALKNVAPLMELKSRRIGGANYQVPMEVMEPRRTSVGMKWIIAAARAKKGARMAEKLATEIMEAYNKQGAAMKKREDTHRMAEANKAFAHFARFGRR